MNVNYFEVDRSTCSMHAIPAYGSERQSFPRLNYFLSARAKQSQRFFEFLQLLSSIKRWALEQRFDV